MHKPDDSIHAELREWVEWSRNHYDDPEDARDGLIEYVDWAFQRVAVEEQERSSDNSLHTGRAGFV